VRLMAGLTQVLVHGLTCVETRLLFCGQRRDRDHAGLSGPLEPRQQRARTRREIAGPGVRERDEGRLACELQRRTRGPASTASRPLTPLSAASSATGSFALRARNATSAAGFAFAGISPIDAPT